MIKTKNFISSPNKQKQTGAPTSFSIRKKPLSILLISDFFYPKIGGVEVHIYQLAVSLVRLGCKVTVLTHHRKNRQGIKIMGNGIKVYFNPMITMYDDTTFPTIFGTLKVIREVVLLEKIDIIHCHQSTSVLSLESLMHSKALGLNTIFTEHSLYGFGQLHEISINKVVRVFFVNVDEIIGVSHIASDNVILRSLASPLDVHTIPNGIDNTKFRPPSEKELEEQKIKNNNCNSNENEKNNLLTIVSVSRLTYRKGTDLLIEVIPEICKQYPNVNFIIGGDGPKKILLEKMVKASCLEDRVKMTGFLPHQKVRDVMIQGQIYLNISLTESFCIAIVEAASTGLYTVTTDVGGVGEVLPEFMVKLVKPEKESIIQGIKETIQNFGTIKTKMKNNYGVLKSIYNWDKVARKTVQVYQKALNKKDVSFYTRIKKSLTGGGVSGFMYLVAFLVDMFLLIVFTIIQPVQSFEQKRGKKEFKYKNYRTFLEKKKSGKNNKNISNKNNEEKKEINNKNKMNNKDKKE